MKLRSKIGRVLLTTGVAAAAVGFVPLATHATNGINTCGAQYEIGTRSNSGTIVTTHVHTLAGYPTVRIYKSGTLSVSWPAQGGTWSASPSGSWNCY